MSLLTDPAAVAVVRAMLAAGRDQNMVRRKFRLGRTVLERRWESRDLHVFLKRGSDRGQPILWRHELSILVRTGTGWEWLQRDVPVTSAQQVADLLGAVGLMSVELTSGYKAALGLVSVPLRRGLIESGIDVDRQIKAHMDRGDSAAVIFHAGARAALQAVHDVMTGSNQGGAS